jgi:cyanophycinase-like exopeptidase
MIRNLQNLFLIGGGVMRNNETANLDKWLVKKATKNGDRPKVLFVPTASHDLAEYITDFTNRYTSYGSEVDVLLLANVDPSKDDVKNKILLSDMIYFGGGDMSFAFERFNKYDLESLLKEAVKVGTLIGGLSAGAAMLGSSFLDFEWNGSSFVNFHLNKGYGWVDNIIWTHFSMKFLESKDPVSVIERNRKVLGIGDGTMVYWDQDNNMRIIKNGDIGVCVICSLSDSGFNIDPALQINNVNRNI